MAEIWKSIPGFEGQYEVSSMGRVRSLDRTVTVRAGVKSGYLQQRKGAILRPGKNTKQGHVTVSLGRRNSLNVHRIVMLAFKGPCPHGLEVLHINGKAADNRLSNLRYGTRRENNLDIGAHGRRKISVAQARAIKKHINRSEASALKLAAKYKISRSYVWQIWQGKQWTHV